MFVRIPTNTAKVGIPIARYNCKSVTAYIVRQQPKSSHTLYTAPMIRFLCLLVALPLLAATPEQQIRQVLDDQVAAWNRGDIPGFMDGYDKSDATTFVSATVTKGHAQVLAGYLQRYPTREKMGTLRFTDLEIKL